MLKNYGYGGAFRDENITVSLLLENPLDHGLEASALVFSVSLSAKNNSLIPHIEDFTFYIMDEDNRLYNTQKMPIIDCAVEAGLDDEEPILQPDILIYADFQYNFLFQDLRICFRYRHYDSIRIIELTH